MSNETLARFELELAELHRQQQRVIDAITECRYQDATWQAIADVFGHGNRAAAKRWYERRTRSTK